MKKRTNKTKEEFSKLIHKYFTEFNHMRREDFCKKENISMSAFYRYLKIYNTKQEFDFSEPKAEFIELKSAKVASKQNVWIKLFGFKLLKLQLEYV